MPEQVVLCILCVIRRKTLNGAQLEEIRFLWPEDVGCFLTYPIGLQALIESGKFDRYPDFFHSASKSLDVKALYPSDWDRAEIGQVALSDLIPVSIVSTQASVGLFKNLLHLYDRGRDSDDDHRRFDALVEQVNAVKNAVTCPRDGNSFADMQNEIIRNLLKAISSIPSMILLP